MLRLCTVLLLVGTLMAADPSPPRCIFNGFSYNIRERWVGEVGDCTLYECTSKGIQKTRCSYFLDSLGAEKIQQVLDLIQGTNCTLESEDSDMQYPGCCNRIMCLNVTEPSVD